MEVDPSSFISKKDKIFFATAKEVSKLSDHRCKLGCVIVDHHRIIGSGYNSKTKCHRLQAELDKKFFGMESMGPKHAEFTALLPLIKKKVDLTNATLYVYRETADHNLAMARPCPRCMSLIKKYGIKKIKYTTPDGFAIERVIKEED